MSAYIHGITSKTLDERYLDQELRRISDSSIAVNELLQGIEAIRSEHAVLRDGTAFTGSQLDTYSSSYLAAAPQLSAREQLITLDVSAGTITIGYAGLYRLSAYVLSTEAGNGVFHSWTVNASISGAFALGAYTTSNQASGYVMSASGLYSLAVGDVITLQSATPEAIIDIANSDLEVELVKAT